jgi:hypothetical protein
MKRISEFPITLLAIVFVLLGTGSLTLGQKTVSVPAPDFLVTNNTVGQIRIGMTIADVRRILKEARFERGPGEGADEIEVKLKGKSLMWFTASPGDENYDSPVDGKTKIFAISVGNSKFQTSAGVRTGMTIAEAEKIYGKIRAIIEEGLTGDEFAVFTNHPEGIDFSVSNPKATDDPYSKVGKYIDGKIESKSYVKGSTISSIDIPASWSSYFQEKNGKSGSTQLRIGNVTGDYSGCSCIAQTKAETLKQPGKFLFYADNESPDQSALFNINGKNIEFKLLFKGRRPAIDKVGSFFSDIYQADGITIEVAYVTTAINHESADYDITITAVKNDMRVTQKAVGSCGC